MKKKNRKNNIYIGTSGWSFNWEVLFNEDIKKRDKLKFYSENFNSAEANYSFYRLPTAKTIDNWKKEVNNNFKFSLKLSSYITHNKRLEKVKTPLKKFLQRYRRLDKNAGPILVQLPQNFHFDKEKLEKFLKTLEESRKDLKLKPLKIAFEFRHESWFENKETISILKKYKATLVFAHSSKYPYPDKEDLTSPYFIYFRLHGPKELFSSLYSKKELEIWKKKIIKLSQKRQVYFYFNNDKHNYSMKNLLTLKELLNDKK